MRPVPALLVASSLLLASPAEAHGLWGHVHVTGWAAENMPDDDLRAFLLDDPEVFNALLFGATFTDTGYARDVPGSRAYAEATHWEPFIEAYVAWIRANDPPPWTSLESKKRVAFLLGCASHGLQDEIFDSTFLYEVEQKDGSGQEVTDPATDGFLALDGHIRFLPRKDLPMDTLLELYAEVDPEITAEVIDGSVDLVLAAYVNDELGLAIAASNGERLADEMPWGRAHYLDPEVPGSLRAEIYPTMRYQQAVWKRLHGELDGDDVAIFAFPELPRRGRSGDPASVESWVTLIFGEGVRYEGDLLELVDDSGAPVAFSQANTRWNAEHTRLMRILPIEPLAPGAWYTARLRAGAERIGGGATTGAWELRFQVACATPDDPACGDLGEIAVASIDGLPQQPEEPVIEEATGCGCRSAPGVSAALYPLLIGLVAGVSRRRR